jgi:hypothetical protein
MALPAGERLVGRARFVECPLSRELDHGIERGIHLVDAL